MQRKRQQGGAGKELGHSISMVLAPGCEMEQLFNFVSNAGVPTRVKRCKDAFRLQIVKSAIPSFARLKQQSKQLGLSGYAG